MTNSISGIPTSRISDLFVREQLLNQIQISQADLFRIQTQLSTGRRFQSISDDPVSAINVIGLQSLMERKAQVQENIDTNQAYLSISDSALGSVSDLLTQVRGIALGVVDVTATDIQRSAAAQQVEQTLQQLLYTGNQQFRGRYLFSGSESATEPFKAVGDVVEYSGNEQRLSSYADLNMLFDTNLNGNEVFGAISSQVQGKVKITPDLTYDTRLADLRQGQGVSKGSILVSDGHNTSTIDISGAETIGDLAAIIHAHPPQGRELNVDITADKIILQLDTAGGGNFSIREVGGGTVADELGIRRDNGVGNNPITGIALDPILRGTTSLQNILGAYASTVVHSTGRDNDILIKADTIGATTSTGLALNDVEITFVDDPAVSAGHEFVEPIPFDGHTVTVHIDAGFTRAYQVVNAINNADLPFTARLDPADEVNDGQGIVEAGAGAITRDGSGEQFDQQSGLRITNGGREYNIDLSTCNSVEDVLNAVNANSGLLAEINATKDGIDIRSRDSGADFMIAENGGKTASQLGLRTFTGDTALDDLNFGRGVGKVSAETSSDGNEHTIVRFKIVRSDGVELKIDSTDPQTIGDVLNIINQDPNNADGLLVARLAVNGNGIELVDNSTGTGALSVIADPSNNSAVDLGLIPVGKNQSDSAAVNYAAKLISTRHTPNTGIIITSNDSSVNNVEIVFDATVSDVTYDAVAQKLTIGIVPGTTTASNVIEAVNASSVSSLFHAALDPTDGSANDGSGKVDLPSTATMAEAKVLDGRDVNKTETEGVFTALLRLKLALENNDTVEIERSIGLLDKSTQNLNTVQGELGAREQGLDVMKNRLSSENIELQKVLSNVYDIDITQVVSDLAGKQAAFEASLRSTASILQMSLLNYL